MASLCRSLCRYPKILPETALRKLRKIVHTIADVFEGQGISGAKGRDKRPAFDRLLKAAVRREVDMIGVWSSDRLGRP